MSEQWYKIFPLTGLFFILVAIGGLLASNPFVVFYSLIAVIIILIIFFAAVIMSN